MPPVKPVVPLLPPYQQLQRQLTRLGYLSQGSVFERAPGQQGSRYVWTRKVKAKTVTVALSAQQYQWLRKAVTNQRQLEKIVKQMQALSRQVLFKTIPGVTRRKRLSKKVLGLI
jgi:virulence-associated protein VapD